MNAPATIGHNLPPIVPPKDTEMLADLENRYPEVKIELDAFDEALATYPKTLKLEDEETAAALQDLLGKIKKTQSVFGAHKKSEKKPWDTLVKVVQNFFGKAEERTDKMLEVWKPVHEAFLDLKKEDTRRKAEEEAERQRVAAEASRLAAEKAAEEQRKAEAEAAAARKREEEARARADEEERKRKEAEERRLAAEAEERRLAEEKKVRDREEKELNNSNLREIRGHLKEADRLHILAEAEEATDEDIAALADLVRPAGIISHLAAPVAASLLLDDEQKEAVEKLRARLNELRAGVSNRASKAERKRQEKAQAEADARERDMAEKRRLQREEDERRAEAAKKEREAAEAARDKAREEKKKAEAEAKAALGDAKDATADAKAAGRDSKAAATDADRAENRADRLDRKVEQSTDADLSRTRGDLGTVGSLTKRWKHYITDEALLRAKCGPLGEHFTEAALNGAVYQWMAAHRSGFTGERVEGMLPGVVFAYEQEVRIA